MRQRLLALSLVVLVLLGGMVGRWAMSASGAGYRMAMMNRLDGSINIVDSNYLYVINGSGVKTIAGISPCSTPWSLAGESTSFILGCNDALYFSSNSGRSWKKYVDGHFLAVAVRSGVWVGCAWNQGVYISYDYGAHWQKADINPTDAEINAVGISNKEIVLASLLGVMVSTDAKTFSLVKGLPTRFSAIEVEPSAVYAGNWMGEVWKEDSNGWSKLPSSKAGIWGLAEYSLTRATAQGLERPLGIPQSIKNQEAINVIVSGSNTYVALAGRNIFVMPANVLVKDG